MRGATGELASLGVQDLISIHAPRAGRDSRTSSMRRWAVTFQSTRPVRGATVVRPILRKVALVISIHAPRAGRDVPELSGSGDGSISIHAPRAGRDKGWHVYTNMEDVFQSTRPVRGATDKNLFRDDGSISIHAPRAGRD